MTSKVNQVNQKWCDPIGHTSIPTCSP